MQNKSLRTRGLVATFAGLATVAALAQVPGLKNQDVGAPGLPGSTTFANGKYTIVGGGNDIWNTSDNFHYAYITVTGDFDYIVKVESLTRDSTNGVDDGWSKAELMAREIDEATYSGPYGSDRFIAVMTTRSDGQNEVGLQWRSDMGTLVSGSGSGCAWPNDIGFGTPVVRPAYPNTWLRLERVGNSYWGYNSTDGTTWTVLRGSPYVIDAETLNGNEAAPRTDGPMAAKLAVGMAVTGHQDLDTSTGVFSGFAKWTPVPIAITTQPPATVSIAANSTLTIPAAATGDPVHYQWYKGADPVPGQISATLSIPLAQISDSGTYTVRCFGAGQTPVTSTATVVSVTVDTTPPTVVAAKPLGQDSIRVTFSEPVTAPTATTTSNYQLSPAVAVTAATLSADGFSVTLTTALQALNTKYNLTVTNVRDGGANPIGAGNTASFTSVMLLQGYAYYERWDDGSGDMGDLNAFGTALDDGSARPPDVSSVVSQFGGPWGATDNYNARVRTYFTAPSNGNYVFFVAADDGANVYLSTDDKPANKKLICNESGWSNQYQWTLPGSPTAENGGAEFKRSDLFASTEWETFNTITLQANKTYYMEVRWNEGTGGDGADVTFIKEGDADPSNDANGMFMKGNVISWYESPDVLPPVINTHPVDNVTLAQGESTTLTVAATNPGADELKYQWTLNGVDIPGATSASYTIASATLADMGQYRVKVSNKNATIWSGGGSPNPTIVMVKATGVFAIEGEDFDYDSGKSKDEASVMPYLGGAYSGLSAVWGVDYNNDDEPANNYVNVDGLTDPQEYNNPPDHPVYRWGGDLDVGFDAADPNKNATIGVEQPGGLFATTRLGEWTMTANYKLGWVGTGNWGNYTRTFPTPAKEYYIFASSSYDGVSDGQINGSIGLVTDGVGTATQTVQPIGSYTAQGSGDWSRNNLVPARGTDGQLTTVELGGKQTIRWTYNSGDAEALLFVPVPIPATAEIKGISLSGGNVVIEYTGVLQSAAVVTGPYTDVTGASNPYSTGATAAQMYFRSRSQ